VKDQLSLKKTWAVAMIAILFLSLAGSDAYGQRRRILNLPKYEYQRYHFGFTLGFNEMNFTIKPKPTNNTTVWGALQTPDLNIDSSMLLSVNSDPVQGFTIGIVGDMRLGKYFNFRFIPALSFGERFINYSILAYKRGQESILEIEKRVASTYVDLPFLIKYKSKRLNNFRAYVLAGMQYNIDLASTARRKDENKEVHVKLERHDISFVAGVGFDFYNPWFKFGVELRMNYGLRDLMSREGTLYTDGVDFVKSKIFQVLVTFE
jgi:hypothetical protein